VQGHRARKRFSQNFLHDAGYIERIVAAVDPREGDRIVEIGPGLGALTAPLIERARRIECVEIDRDLAARLRERYPQTQLTLHEGDALRFDWAALAARDPYDAHDTHDARPLKIVGNLPYHISTPLLFALLPIAARVHSQHFMLQKEVVDRITADPATKDYGRLTVMLRWRYYAARLFVVPAGAFSPAPKVQSAVVRLTPRAAGESPRADAQAFGRVVAAAFNQRRKTLRNALGGLIDESGIRAAGVDPGARAETLDCAAFAALALHLSPRLPPPGAGDDCNDGDA
jgi:16S rRNA (adenine1518-N6/adenine1519-N6)-dimethyltransferase